MAAAGTNKSHPSETRPPLINSHIASLNQTMPRHRRYPAGRAATVVAVVVVQMSSSLPPSSTSPPRFVAEAHSSSSSCVDTADWRDMYGDTCAYYSSGTDRCEVWGGKGAGEMGVADDNCCVCGGGTDAKTTASTAGGGGVRGGTTTKTMTAATTRPVDINLADAGDIVVVNPDGTCGKGDGDRGNGICRDGKCCSRVRRDYFPLLANVFLRSTRRAVVLRPLCVTLPRRTTLRVCAYCDSATHVTDEKFTSTIISPKTNTNIPSHAFLLFLRQFGWCGDTQDHCRSPEPTPSPITPIPTYYPTYAPITGSPTGSSMPSFDYDDPQAWSHGTYAVASEIGEDVEIKMPPATKVGDTLFLFLR